MTDKIETPYAVLTRTGTNEIEIRFTSGILLDKAAIAQVIQERKRMSAGRSVGLLLIIPPDTELDVDFMGTDHLKANQATDNVLGFAVVAGSAVAEALLRLYRAYYPTPFHAEVFTDEVEARGWLRKQVAKTLEPSKG